MEEEKKELIEKYKDDSLTKYLNLVSIDNNTSIVKYEINENGSEG